MRNIKLSVIMTAHNESLLIGPSLKSVELAIRNLHYEEKAVQKLIALDNPNKDTEAFVEANFDESWKIFKFNIGDISEVRNRMVTESSGEYLAFIDGDDLFSENWLSAALIEAEADKSNSIYHPELNWIFGNQNHVWIHTSSNDPCFTPYYYYFGNHYDALCLAKRECYESIKFVSKSRQKNIGYEDWTWAMDTTLNGYQHKVVRDTIIFKRRRLSSVSVNESSKGYLPFTSKLQFAPIIKKFQKLLTKL